VRLVRLAVFLDVTPYSLVDFFFPFLGSASCCACFINVIRKKTGLRNSCSRCLLYCIAFIVFIVCGRVIKYNKHLEQLLSKDGFS
jgi:hypothetical protein